MVTGSSLGAFIAFYLSSLASTGFHERSSEVFIWSWYRDGTSTVGRREEWS